MTEAEWDACADPTPMLEFLRGKAGGRKLRLAACACVRRVWRHLADARLRRAVEVAGRFADDEATTEELGAACRDAGYAEYEVGIGAPTPLAEEEAARAARVVAGPDAELAAAPWPRYAARAVYWDAAEAGDAYDVAEGDERKAQSALLRDVFGSPFRPVALDASCLAWNDGTARNMAEAIYDGRTFDRLPLLVGHLLWA